MELLRYKYYDTPEGHDLLPKLVYVNKYSGALGIVWASYDVALYTRPVGVVPTIGRYFYHVGYLTAMATAFTATTFALNRVTGEDTKLNYTIGGIVSGSIMGAYAKKAFHGYACALALGLAGFLKKLSIEEGWQFFPSGESPRMIGDAVTIYRDFSLQKDFPKGWTTDPNDA